jgi:cytidine deaminase
MLHVCSQKAKNYNAFYNSKYCSIGINSDRSRYNNIRMTTHAEMNAIDIMIKKTICKKKTINLIVLRVHKNNTLSLSQPCYHCSTEMMKNKHVNIKYLFFSDENGDIQKHDFNTWYNETNHHISSGWRCAHH